MMYFGQVILPVDAGADLITAVTGVLTSNLGVVLAVLGFFVGLRVIRGFLNRGTKGKL